jgi:hypothetical protein
MLNNTFYCLSCCQHKKLELKVEAFKACCKSCYDKQLSGRKRHISKYTDRRINDMTNFINSKDSKDNA